MEFKSRQVVRAPKLVRGLRNVGMDHQTLGPYPRMSGTISRENEARLEVNFFDTCCNYDPARFKIYIYIYIRIGSIPFSQV